MMEQNGILFTGKKLDFKVTFLSDIVLQSSSNTEGKIDNLDFISGSSFLGIVAKNYDSFENPFEVFHSGKVRFGEATPFSNNQSTYKVPFCFFTPKLDDKKEEVKNNHFIKYEEQKELDKQYKQIRTGYITSNLDYLNLDCVYSQKAAYDKENRKSKDSTMFGYKAIQKGTTWKFSITFNDIDEKTQNQVLENILGEKYLGKSKTSQYGKIKIEELKDFKDENIENLKPNETTFIYINSSLALFDKNGMPTFEPTKENLGLKDATIDWGNTQIRTKTITPFNFIRQTNDYSRLIIEKGSVIALKNASSDDINNLKAGIGAYLSEGYGEILINPIFLLKEENFSLNKKDLLYEKIENIKIKEDDLLISFLTQKSESKTKVYDLGKEVQTFIDKHKKEFETVSKSQWGQIRMLVQFNQNKDDYIEKIKDFITHGTSKKQWKNAEETFFIILEKESIEFIKLLSMMMPKIKDKPNEGEKNDK